MVSDETDICVEGFQRSGNGYFLLCFKVANKGLKIAHHLHSNAQVKIAINKNIPTVVLIRQPADAIASLLTMDESLSVGLSIQGYIDFYQPLLKLKRNNKLVSILFDDLINNYNEQLEKVNGQFGTAFNLSTLTKQQLQDRMDKRNKGKNDDKATPFPNAFKKQRNLINKNSVISHSYYKKAESLYQEWVFE